MAQHSRAELEAMLALCRQQLAEATHPQTRDALNCILERLEAELDAMDKPSRVASPASLPQPLLPVPTHASDTRRR
jgi:hypothetical protein